MLGSSGRQERRKHPLELRVLGTTSVPESCRVGESVEAEDLLNAPVTVRRDDQVLPGQPRCAVWDANEHIMVKLALLVVQEEVEPAPLVPQVLKKGAKHPLLCEPLHDRDGSLGHSVHARTSGN